MLKSADWYGDKSWKQEREKRRKETGCIGRNAVVSGSVGEQRNESFTLRKTKNGLSPPQFTAEATKTRHFWKVKRSCELHGRQTMAEKLKDLIWSGEGVWTNFPRLLLSAIFSFIWMIWLVIQLFEEGEAAQKMNHTSPWLVLSCDGVGCYRWAGKDVEFFGWRLQRLALFFWSSGPRPKSSFCFPSMSRVDFLNYYSRLAANYD